MRVVIFLVFLVVAITGCKRDPIDILSGRWSFESINFPGSEKFVNEISHGSDTTIAKQTFLLGNKLILRKDRTFDLVFLKQYIHGSWMYESTTKNLVFKDSSGLHLDFTAHLDGISFTELRLQMDQFVINRIVQLHSTIENDYFMLSKKPYYKFLLKLDGDKFDKPGDDPYSVDNNRWRIKPLHPEADEQVKERVVNFLGFWQVLFEDADKNDRPYVSYNWFDSPLVVAVNGVQLDYYSEHEREWELNFFDSAQAHLGYQWLRASFNKKLDFLKSDNKYNKSQHLIEQLKANCIDASQPDQD